ncbi:MAG: GntR family transcriptional regulator [Brachymonas sp.]|nr:GntR family transcriptional regulator [Brachymonas sp.]
MTQETSSVQLSSTQHIVQALTRAMVEHRLAPGAKLVEQKLADHFGVSRTLVRQALYQLENQRLVVIEPARGAFVASPSIEEASQVFEVRRMVEAQMTRAFAQQATPEQIAALREHVVQEQKSIASDDTSGRIELLGDFHVRMAELMGNTVLAELLSDLISRCALVTLMYQSTMAAKESNDEHVHIVEALASGDADKAVMLMDAHLSHVLTNLQFERQRPDSDAVQALSSFAGL